MNNTFEMVDFPEEITTYEDLVVDRTDVDGLIVSTVYTCDRGYETAILDNNGVHPVERYDNRALAQEGHDKWCKQSPFLTNITRLGWIWIGEEEVELVRIEDEE